MHALLACAILSFAVDSPRDSYRGEQAVQPAQLAEFLKSGFSRRSTSPAALDRAFQKFDTRASQDPAVRYAYAISLLKRNQFDEASAVLDPLRLEDSKPYVPAWRASIWNHLVRRDFDTAFAQLIDFSRLTTDENQSWTTSHQAEANAFWIGRLLASLDFQIQTGHDHERFQTAWMEVEHLFEGSLREKLYDGMRQTHAERLEFEAQLVSSRTEAAEQQEQQFQAEAKDLTTEAAETIDQKEQLKLTAQEWKKKLDDALLEFGKELGSMERDYQFLNEKRASLERSGTLAQRELNLVQTELLAFDSQGRLTGQPGQSRLSSGRNYNQLIIDERRLLDLLADYQGQYRENSGKLQAVIDQGNQLLAARQNLINDYQRATGELVKKDNKLDRMAKKLAKEQEKLKTEDPTQDTTEIKKLRIKMDQFQTYVSFDLEEEKQRLIDAHQPPKEPVSGAAP